MALKEIANRANAKAKASGPRIAECTVGGESLRFRRPEASDIFASEEMRLAVQVISPEAPMLYVFNVCLLAYCYQAGEGERADKTENARMFAAIGRDDPELFAEIYQEFEKLFGAPVPSPTEAKNDSPQ